MRFAGVERHVNLNCFIFLCFFSCGFTVALQAVRNGAEGSVRVA
jgi:hypothetical protein